MGIVYNMLNVSKMQGIRRRGVSSRVPIGTINYILIKVFSSKKKKKKNPLNPKDIYPKLGFSETFFLIYGREKRRL